MNRLEAILHGAAEELEMAAADWALVGGLAVSVRTEPRFTRDVDIAVAVSDDAAAEALIKGRVARGWSLVATVEQEATGRLATARLLPPGEPGDGVLLDLLFASSGIEPEIVAAGEPLTVMGDLAIRVARVGHLVALKLLAEDAVSRPQDRVDLAQLLAAASPADLELARESVQLVTERGYARGRDLAEALDQLLEN